MTRLQQLHDEQDQSPWLDNLPRPYLRDGTLARLVNAGVRGVAANPTIFAKAIEGSDAYDAQLADLIGKGRSVSDAYWAASTGSFPSRSPLSWRATARRRSRRRASRTSGSIDRICS